VVQAVGAAVGLPCYSFMSQEVTWTADRLVRGHPDQDHPAFFRDHKKTSLDIEYSL